MSALTQIFGTNNDITAEYEARKAVANAVLIGWAEYPRELRFSGPQRTKTKQQNQKPKDTAQ